MAGYGSARDFAKLLGLKEVAAQLDETLAEEKNADKTLTVASKKVNAQAEQEAQGRASSFFHDDEGSRPL